MKHRGVIAISGGLIALYLAVYYAQGTTSDLGAGGNAAAGIIRTFQGR